MSTATPNRQQSIDITSQGMPKQQSETVSVSQQIQKTSSSQDIIVEDEEEAQKTTHWSSKLSIKKSVQPSTSPQSLSQEVVGQDAALKQSSSYSNIVPDYKREQSFLQRIMTMKSKAKSASMNNINPDRPVHVKSILKKRVDITSTTEDYTIEKDIALSMKDKESVENSVEYLHEDGRKGYIPITFANKLQETVAYRISSPDLRRLVLRPQVASVEAVKQSGSVKSLSFNMDSTTVIETHSKTFYNRKTGNDITFKKLTPSLKEEIRSELNDYKRTEMSVHEESQVHTVYH